MAEYHACIEGGGGKPVRSLTKNCGLKSILPGKGLQDVAKEPIATGFTVGGKNKTVSSNKISFLDGAVGVGKDQPLRQNSGGCFM